MDDFLTWFYDSLPAVIDQLWLIPRFIVAGICGGLIGIERKNRSKEAGVRTHLIVALASALMMIISKYGFFDVLSYSDAIKLDPSRVASGIVTGIGFLGAGMIFVRKQVINGLTTAAGIWATVGVGMAFGAGMYVIGISATVVIVLFQIFLHKNTRLLASPISEQICIRVKDFDNVADHIKAILEKHRIDIVDLSVTKSENGELIFDALVRFPPGFAASDALEIMRDSEYIVSVQL